jgi:two-component system, chemotaxis family, protein-glutamate methylesterase/glutaminase
MAEEVGRVRVQVNRQPRENFCRPSVDVLSRSVARVYRGAALGLIRTGMGEASSAVLGMPRATW